MFYYNDFYGVKDLKVNDVMNHQWLLKHHVVACDAWCRVSPQLKGAHNVDGLYTNNNNTSIRLLHLRQSTGLQC